MERAEAIDLDTLDLTAIALPETGERLIHDTKAKGLALRLRASGARTWVMFGKDGSKTVRRTLGSAKLLPLDTARRICAANSVDAADGKNTPAPTPRFGPDASISELMPRFLASGAMGRWKASTLRNMRAAAEGHILPLLGGRKARDLASEDVAKWHLDVAAKSSAVRMALSTLSGLMTYAEDHGLRPTGSNPCRGLRKKNRSNRGQLLSAATVKRLWGALDALQGQMPDACDVIRLLLLTGARRSEILALEWNRIVGPRAVLEDSKTGPRTIWLNAPARSILDARKAGATSDHVFPAAKRDGHTTMLDRHWATIRAKAKLGTLRLHDLRHHYASIAVSNGIDLRIVGQLLGHQDIDSTLGYAHLTTDSLMRSASRVSGRIDRSLRGASPNKPRRANSRRRLATSAQNAAREATNA